MKRCKHCATEKPLDDYYADSQARDGRRPECKDCTKARRKRWYAANREREIAHVLAWQRENPEMLAARMDEFRAAGKKKVSDRKSHLKRNYGLTLEAFDDLLAAQGGGCAICGRQGADHVDHDHATGEVRGILCFRCNVALGQLGDDPERLIAALAYLDRDDELTAFARDRVLALTS